MIKSMIIDDEKHSCEALHLLLKAHCRDVEVISIAHSGEAALQQLKTQNVQLIFLDIEMPHMNGFELLQQLPSSDIAIIFTTSYDQYALRAFRFSALDYLLKPIDREELVNAVSKVQSRAMPLIQEQLSILFQKISRQVPVMQKVALPTMSGLELVALNSIIRCSANNNYTEFFLSGSRSILVSRTLKEVEEMLEGHAFLRVHHSYLVNLNEIVRYVRGEGGYLIMSDGSHIDVSRSRKDELLRKLQRCV